MLNIKLMSVYPEFTPQEVVKNIRWDDESKLVFYSDIFVTHPVYEENACALLIEPRSIQPQVYKYMETHYNKFKYVFTHDSILLRNIPNGKQIYWGGVWNISDEPKTKNISFCSSNKTICIEHRERLALAKQLDEKIDCMGTFNGGRRVSTKEIYAPYRFSVAIENYVDDYWFTEKLCNCFANKTIPIYYGARKISDLFNTDGMFLCNSISGIKGVINYILKEGPEKLYEERKAYIDDNFERVKRFVCFEDEFYNMYKDLLEDLL